MFCSNCGAKLNDDALFCGECGTRVEAVVAAAVEETREVVEVAEGEATVDAVKVEATPVAEPVKQEEASVPGKKKGGKGGLVALIIVLVLLLAGGGVAAWYFTGDAYISEKNMKLAEAAFAEGELVDAKEYYEVALEYDETIIDAYIKLADIDMQEGKYDSAIKTLKEGIQNTQDVEGATAELTVKLEEAYMAAIDDRVKVADYADALAKVEEAIAKLDTPTFVQKKKDIYQNMITAEMVESDYWGAISVANEAFDATGDNAFEEKKAEAYSMLAKIEIANGEYDYAWGLIEQGLYEVESQSLKDDKVSLFNNWIDSYVEEESYNSAIRKAEQAFEETGDEAFNEKIVEIYLTWADAYIAKGDYTKARSVLEDGINDTQSAELSAKVEEINNMQVLISKKVVDVAYGTAVVYYYNANGQETEIQYLDEEGNLTQKRTYIYDEEGNVSEFAIYNAEGTLQGKELHVWAEVEGKKQCVITYLDGEERVLRNEIVDEEGEMLSYTEYYVEDGSVRLESQNMYDEAGNLLETVTTIDGETFIQKNEYIYDEAGNMLEWVAYTDEGIMELRETYDEKGNILQVLRYDEAGEEVVVETEYTYDEADRMLTQSVKSEDANYHSEYTYNDAGEKVKTVYVDDNTGDETATVYNITLEGNVKTTETIDYFNGEQISYAKYVAEYGADSKLLKAELLDEAGMLLGSEVIEYDEKGNEVYKYSNYNDMYEEYYITNEYGFPQ